MGHVYFSMLGTRDVMHSKRLYIEFFGADNQESVFIPILHIESDNKESIREEMVRYIDSVLNSLYEEN